MLYQLIFLWVCVVACPEEFYDLPKDDYTPEQLRYACKELGRRKECFMDRGPCTCLTTAYRNIAEDMVLTACEKCSHELKCLTRAFLNGMKEYHPATYKELIFKYDPTTTHFNAFEEAVGVEKTVLSSLPSIPSLPSITSLEFNLSLTLLPSCRKP